MNDSRPRVLAILPAFIPSTQICIVKPLIRLHQEKSVKAKITLEYLTSPKELEWADIIIFCRNTEFQYAWILDYVINRNIPFIYDIDDNFFEVPLDSELGRYHRHPARLAMHNRYLQSADLVRVYSDPLLERAKALNASVEKVLGPVDWDLIFPPKVPLKEKPIKLVYTTSRLDDDLATLFIPAIKRVLDQYGEKLEVHFWGFKPKGLDARYRVHYHAVVTNYDRYMRRFSREGFDIGLAPLEKDLFHRSKTNNKFREYAACGIAGIYSDVDVYSTCVSDGETGLLVSNETDSWYKAIVRLIESEDLRKKIKRQALEYMRLHYPKGDFEKVWWDQIERLLGEVRVRSSSSDRGNTIPEVKKITGNYGMPQKQSRIAHVQEKIQNLIRHMNEGGISFTIQLIKWKLYDQWMVWKLRLMMSSVFVFFNRKKV